MSTQETKLKAIADAIREKDGTEEPIAANDFPERIRAIQGGGGIELESIEITTPPGKVKYHPGEMFDPAGMVVTATYSNGATLIATGWAVEPAGPLPEGLETVMVRYTEGGVSATASQSITVTSRWLFGFDINNADSNPATRVSYPDDVDNAGFTAAKMNFDTDTFSYGDWPSTPGEKFMPRPCMLRFDGTVAYYLDPDDYTKKEDGTPSDAANISFGGNAMMEWPKIYTKRWEKDGVYHFRCSDAKVDEEYECWCNYDRLDNEISHFYTPIFFGSKDSSNRLRSISGQNNSCYTTAQEEVIYAQANGDDWYTEVVSDWFLLQDLLVMIFKSTDLQSVLGAGVVHASTPITQGSMNAHGLFWGAGNKTSGVKASGMENMWGNLWRRIAGWTVSNGVSALKITRGTKDGTTEGYNFNGFGYIIVENVALTSEGYISRMHAECFGRIPQENIGSSAAYESDYVRASNDSDCYVSIGGDYDSDLRCGPFFVNYLTAPSASGSRRGAALSCKPLASIQARN